MSLIESRDILNKLCSNDYYRGDDVQCAIQCLAEGGTINRVRTLEDVGQTVIDEKLKDRLMKLKDKGGAFDDVNWAWLLPLLLFLPTLEPPHNREITINANASGKSVNITYDPHDAEAVKAAEAWRKALFSAARWTYEEPIAVCPGDTVTFTGPRKETNGDKIRKADISTLSELLAAVKFGLWDNSYEIKPGVSVPRPEIFNKLNAYAGRMAGGDITCLDLIRAMTDNDLSEWLCLFQTREAEAWERLMGAPPDYSKPLIPESEREKFFFWLKKRSGTDCASEPPKPRLTRF